MLGLATSSSADSTSERVHTYLAVARAHCRWHDQQVEPEESNPELLVGRHVVEIGMRQAWPFLTIADGQTGREVRVYVDAPLSVPGSRSLRQDDPMILSHLDRVRMETIIRARLEIGALVLDIEGEQVRIEGEGNELTTGPPWWVGLQTPGQADQTKERRKQFGIKFRLSLQRALWREIVPSIRAIAMGWDEDVGRARFIFDDVPSEDERELVAVAETEVIADFPPKARFEFTTDVSVDDQFGFVEGEQWWAYVRWRPDE